MTLAWCYNGTCKSIALELHNNCFCTFATKLHELYMYMVPHMVGCICCNSCNSFDNIHVVEIC
jgi:hypothetical protein